MLREDSESIYGITVPQMEKHWDGLLELRNHTLIWPDPLDLFRAGSKLNLNNIVHAVALSEGQSYPICATVEPDDDLLQSIMDGTKSLVLKRDWSSSSSHVYTKHTAGGLAGACGRLQAAIEKEEAAYAALQANDFIRPTWFIQPYLPALIIIGEIRAFFVNGLLLRKIITSPCEGRIDETTLENPSMIMPLHRLKY